MSAILFGMSALLALACIANIAVGSGSGWKSDAVWVVGAIGGGVGMFAAAVLP